MSFFDVFTFLQSYSLPTVILALIISAVVIAVDLIFKDKVPAVVKTYAPFVLGIVFYFLYELIFFGFRFNANTLGAGLICASISCVLVSVFNRIKNAKSFCGIDVTVLAVQGIIDDIITKDTEKLAQKITAIITGYGETFDEKTILEIAEIIKNNSDEPINQTQAISLANLVANAYKAIKNL